MLLSSVSATAGMPSRTQASTSALMRMVESTSEYSLCRWKWTKRADIKDSGAFPAQSVKATLRRLLLTSLTAGKTSRSRSMDEEPLVVLVPFDVVVEAAGLQRVPVVVGVVAGEGFAWARSLRLGHARTGRRCGEGFER